MGETSNAWFHRLAQALAVLVILGAAGGGMAYLNATAPVPKPADKTDRRVGVSTVALTMAPVRRQWRGYGTAEPIDSADVPARVNAVVVKIPAEARVGKPVKAGQLLALLDAADFRSEVTIAEQAVAELGAQLQQLDVEKRKLEERAELQSAEAKITEAEMARAESLAGAAVSRREIDQVRRDLLRTRVLLQQTREAIAQVPARRTRLEALRQRAKASLDLATLNLKRCTVVSPIDGVLQAVDIEVGERLSIGSRVARVVEPRRIEVPLKLPASARAGLRPGDPVRIATTGASPHVWDAELSRLGPADDPSSRTLTAYTELSFEGDVPRLAPGAFALGTATSYVETQRWVVPRRSVVGGRVLAVRDGVLRTIPVSIDYSIRTADDVKRFGLNDREWVVLNDAPLDGVSVVLNASKALADGQAVRVERRFGAEAGDGR